MTFSEYTHTFDIQYTYNTPLARAFPSNTQMYMQASRKGAVFTADIPLPGWTAEHQPNHYIVQYSE